MPRKGEKTPPEVRAKMKAAQQARWDKNHERLREQCNSIHFGMKRSTATRKRMSLAHKGLPVPQRPGMPAWLKAIAEEREELEVKVGASGRGSIVSDDGRFFGSAAEAARALGVSDKSVAAHLGGRMKSIGGRFLWRV